MGFLTALTNTGAGALEQVDQNYADMANEQNKMLAQRAQVVDRVVAQQGQMNKEAEDISNAQRSYMTTYGIPADQAYSIASNPDMRKMDPDKLSDLIQRMQPSGQSIPAPQGQQYGQAMPAIHRGSPGVVGALTGGQYNIPGVAGPHSNGAIDPATGQPLGSMRAFTVRKPLMDTTQRMPEYPPPQTPEAAAAIQRIDMAHQNGQTPDTKDVALANQKPKTVAPDEQLRLDAEAFKTTAAAIFNHQISPTQASQFYIQAGGSPQKAAFQWDTIDPKTANDPVMERKAAATAAGLKQLFPGLPDEAYIRYGRYAESGGVASPNNNANAHEATDNYQNGVPVSKHTIAMFNGLNDDGTPLQQNQGNPSQPGRPQPTQTFTAPRPNTRIPGVTKKMYEDSNTFMGEVPKMTAAIHTIEELAKKDPQAIGAMGAITKHIGGMAVNAASFISQEFGNSMDKMLSVSDRKQLETAVDILNESLRLPIMRQFMPSGGGLMGASSKETSNIFDSIFNDESVYATQPGFLKSMGSIADNFYRNYAMGMKQTMDIPDLSNQDALKGTIQFLIGKGLSKEDAFGITHKLESAQQGQGLQ